MKYYDKDKDVLIDFLFIVNNKKDQIKYSDKILKDVFSSITDYTLYYHQEICSNNKEPVSISDFEEVINQLYYHNYNAIGREDYEINDDLIALYDDNQDDAFKNDNVLKYIKNKINEAGSVSQLDIGMIIFDDICYSIRDILNN